MPELKFQLSKTISKVVSEKHLRFALLHAKNSTAAKEIFSDQFIYGHREILLKHAGLDFSNQIIGVIQHGMYYDEEFNFRTPRFLGGKRSKFYTFSIKHQKMANSSGYRNAHAIGAPWLYLKSYLDRASVFKGNEKPRILVMPYHSQSIVPDVSSQRAKFRRARMFREIVGSSEATVCLHQVDFLDSATRLGFEHEGFSVTCMGGTAGMYWSSSGGRIQSLSTLYEMMSRHTHFLTDAIGTSLFYAITMGLQVSVWPQIRKQVTLDSLVSKEHYDDNIDQKRSLDFAKEHIPSAIENFSKVNQYLEVGNYVLGSESVKEAKELKEVLDYRSGIFPKALAIEPW